MELGFTQTYPLWLLASKGAGGLDWAVSKIGEVGVTASALALPEVL